MTDKALFQYIKNNKNWVTTGLDVQFSIQTIKEEQKVYLIFQETRSTFDWKINLLFPAKTYKKYYIHKGYIKAWRSAKTLVAYFINEVEKTGFTPVICGWSYGGAMAVLAAEEYHYQTGKKAEVITFGAPKILYLKRPKKAQKTSPNNPKKAQIAPQKKSFFIIIFSQLLRKLIVWFILIPLEYQYSLKSRRIQ